MSSTLGKASYVLNQLNEKALAATRSMKSRAQDNRETVYSLFDTDAAKNRWTLAEKMKQWPSYQARFDDECWPGSAPGDSRHHQGARFIVWQGQRCSRSRHRKALR